ncbi:MAG: hypothetical protein HXX14_20040 [Bacteroidetes bacterium]|uniref:Uncharacterized protein n=1 Tax=Candidatus Chlorohelix allophototropha TaxID=3003348 RepID=A0A8T7M3H7_9CHLR|nr:hypothetical protein [Chloroflexota bacterium]NWJ53148.1 hypothetical protein [Bacteroidota bacterium]WJW66016.1 hypothetical protein OZ401_001798 [Chloroflexota bacterium L227-S17]
MQYANDSSGLPSRLERHTGNLRRLDSSDSSAGSWLAEIKAELEAKRQADAVLQYRRDAMVTRLMFELNRVHCVELLEEMNRELLNREGRVEPVYNERHELSLTWPVPGGRNHINVGADFDDASERIYLVVTGNHIKHIPVDEAELKAALIGAFRNPQFEVYRW